jgi:hypothetical protein
MILSYLSYVDTAVSQQTRHPRITFEENSDLAEVLPVDYIDETIKAWLEAHPHFEEVIGLAEMPLMRKNLRPEIRCWHATLPPKRLQREETPVRRRDLLKAGIGAAAALAAPRVGEAAAAKTLVVAPTADLVVLDPVVTFNRHS